MCVCVCPSHTQITSVVESLKPRVVDRFSVVGHSLGGLFARFVIGVLEAQHFFDTVTPLV
jgi:predicted alpha/beta superfamily hydrolase